MYICTAADRQYALEAWRLLDSAYAIIPEEMVSRRLSSVSGSEKKSIIATLLPEKQVVGGQLSSDRVMGAPRAVLSDKTGEKREAL